MWANIGVSSAAHFPDVTWCAVWTMHIPRIKRNKSSLKESWMKRRNYAQGEIEARQW